MNVDNLLNMIHRFWIAAKDTDSQHQPKWIMMHPETLDRIAVHVSIRSTALTYRHREGCFYLFGMKVITQPEIIVGGFVLIDETMLKLYARDEVES